MSVRIILGSNTGIHPDGSLLKSQNLPMVGMVKPPASFFQRCDGENHLERLAENDDAIKGSNVGIIGDGVVLVARIPFKLGQFQGAGPVTSPASSGL